MSAPKYLSNFVDLLLASEEIHALVLKKRGVNAACKWAEFQHSENLDELYEIVEAETYERTEEPVSFIEGAAPDNDIFHIYIRRLGPVYFITANEFDDMGYFPSEDAAYKYAQDEFEGFIQELHERRNASWLELGNYSVPGAMTEWECSLDIRQNEEGDWEARWRGEEGAEETHGPSSLRVLFDELVEIYFCEEGEELALMFQESGIPELVAFAKERSDVPEE